MYTLIAKREDIDWFKSPSEKKVSTIDITSETKEGAFAKYFRDYKNRYKYSNSVHISIPCEVAQAEYVEWIGNPNNYANNGGDMY